MRGTEAQGAAGKGVRPQEEHPLVRGDVHADEAGDEGLRLIHMLAYTDAAQRATSRDVLDVGCNDGYGSVVMAQSAARVVGIDVSERAIEEARRRPHGGNVDFQAVAAGALPFADDSFDVVTAFQVIEHLEDPDPVLAEICRVLRPGGHAVFTTPNATIRLDPGMKPWNPFHYREYTADGLADALAASFAHVEVRGVFGPPDVMQTEMARANAARERARHPRPRVLQAVVDMVPPRIRAKVLALVRRDAGSGVIRPQRSVDDLWYAADDLDRALDLQAVCIP